MSLKAIQKLSYGMYIVSSAFEGKKNGQIANTVFQVTSEPEQICVCLNKLNLTHEIVKKSGLFSVSVLNLETPMIFIGKFGFKSGRDIDKFSDTKHIMGNNGIPVVTENSSASLQAKVVSTQDAGTHTLFIGEVVNSQILSDEEAMTYDFYHKVKGGKSPKTAPTYNKEE